MSDRDKMDPKYSPTMAPKTGIKRVNNVPLFIGIAIALLFIGLVLMVALKRAADNTVVPEEKIILPHKDNQKLVAEIIGENRKNAVVKEKQGIDNASNLSAPHSEVPRPTFKKGYRLPTAKPEPQDLVLEEPIDTEMENIRKAKIQAFEEAVKASPHIPLPDHHEISTNTDIDQKQRSIRKELEELKAHDRNTSYEERLQQMKSLISFREEGNRKEDPFVLLNSEKNRWDLGASIEAPKTLFVLRTGAIVPGIMISEVDPRFPGQIIGQVSSHVYDTATGKYLLIPQGSRLVGTYSNDIGYAQEAVLIIWQRIVFPDGKAIDLGAMPGADSAGLAGFKDQVNNHYVRTFGSALLMTGIVGGISYSQQLNNSNYNAQPTAGSVLSEALGQQLGEVTAQMIMKNLNVAPDLHIRTGYPFNVMVTKDITFRKPYQAFDYRSSK